ncbi:hypothetical protein E3P99_01976 [Wallemia hederae]|uniref:RanBD1 domain-containing protein n=1 Tax=Wallemia hederae TaxID=1540922 RepID=A0A4T0FMN7_9BASI|nr:hypothetical protein E3P99_01976 [Wallemia hederae]
MKRGAEKQLTQDDPEAEGDDNSSTQETSNAFTRANESALSQRKWGEQPDSGLSNSFTPRIRGMPKRSAAAATPAPTQEAANSNPFALLSQPSSTTAESKAEAPKSNPFASFASSGPGLGAPKRSDAQQQSSGLFGSFGQSSTQPASQPSFAPATNDTTEKAPAAASGFGSFGSFGSFGAQKPAEPKPQPPAQPKEQTTEEKQSGNVDEDADVHYYASLRGLNKSLVDALKLATEKNPFIDLSSALASVTDEYKKHIASVNDTRKKTKEQSKAQSQPAPKAAPTPAPTPKEDPKPAAPAPPPTFSMPAAGNFSLKPSTSASSDGQSSGFGFKPAATTETTSKSAFSFPASSGFGAPSSTNSAFGSFGSSKKDDKAEDKKEQKDKKELPEASAVNRFAALEEGEDKKSAEKDEKKDDKKQDTNEDKEHVPMEIPPAPKPASAVPKPPTVPSLFSPSTPAPSAPPTPGASNTDKEENNAASVPNPFATKQTVGFGAALGEKKSSVQTSPGFSFGQAATSSSENTPSKGGLSFTFGSASSLPSFPKPAEMDKAPATPPKFSFGGAAPASGEKKEEKPQETEESSESNGDDASSVPAVRSDTKTGEEDEEDLYEVKARLYRFVESWKPSGSGPFKIKLNRETKKKRVLLRDASTTKILLNFNLHQEMKPSADGKQFALTGVEADGSLKMFRLMVKNEELAKKTCEALLKEMQE